MVAAFRYWATLVFVAVVVEVGFAGYGAFYVARKIDKSSEPKGTTEKVWDHGFGAHAGFGYVVVLGGLVLLVLALLAADRRSRAKRPAVLAGLLILQVLLAGFGSDVPAIGFFHPVNALLIFALSGLIAHQAWHGRKPAAP